MQIENTEHVVFTESYLLGWSIRPSKVLLFFQILLAPSHPTYSAHDEDHEFGCYKLAVLTVSGVTSITGIVGQRPPLLSETVDEFQDVDEINKLGVQGNELQLVGDDTMILVSGKSARLEILTDESPNAFMIFLSEA